MKKNWLLCCDLQVQLQNDSLPVPGKRYWGVLVSKLLNDGNKNADQLEFSELEVSSTDRRRNVHLFSGKYVTITLRPDGLPRLNLRNIDLNGIEIDNLCLEMMNEIRLALKSVIGKS
jgi:hypothetical protein